MTRFKTIQLETMANIKHTSLEWSLYDIQSHALELKFFYPNKAEAQEMLEEFFNENEEYIIGYINELMAGYVANFYINHKKENK